MDTLLTVLALWLSVNFALPSADERPRIAFVPATQIAMMRYGPVAGLRSPATALQSSQREVMAVYDDATRTIYLPKGWTGSTPAELSVLVHEMVHHLQNVGTQKFACPQEREALAYKAQGQWLALFGRNLESEFEIDALTLLTSTKCMF